MDRITIIIDQLYQHLPVLLFYLFVYKVEDYNFAIMTENLPTFQEKLGLYIFLLYTVILMNLGLFFTFGTTTPGI